MKLIKKQYDIIFVLGEKFFDHPLCGVAILKRLLEKNNYSVAVIETPQSAEDITQFGKPRLFFGISSGVVDSMVRNYTSLNRPREKDELLGYEKNVVDRAVITYCNWISQKFKSSIKIIGGTEATMRRFTHYDYWQNSIRKSIIFDSRADLLVYGQGEKQILEIANRLKKGKTLERIEGTCLKTKILSEIEKNFIKLPTHEEVLASKEKFCEMQLLFSNHKNIVQKTGEFYIVQYKSPEYATKNIDEYYELPFTRDIKNVPYMQGFQFSVITHRGCIGNCNFCSIRLAMGDKVVSRSEESILRELKYITTLKGFRGIIDDFGGPSANMYGIDFDKDLIKSHERLIDLLREARKITGIKKIFIRSGIRYDMATQDYINEIAEHHISGKLKIAPEHVNENILKLMNKPGTNLKKFIENFDKLGKGELSFYFMTAHPGSSMKEAQELGKAIKELNNCEAVQIFTPTPMTMSTCMYYTSMDPITKKKIYVPYTFAEKKEQKRILGLKDIRRRIN